MSEDVRMFHAHTWGCYEWRGS